MITRDDLKKYQDLLIMIDSLDVEITETYNTYKSPAIISDGGGHASDPGNPTARAMHRIERLKAERARIQNQIEEIETFVSNIKDPRERAICNLHYLTGYTWSATCWRMRKHYSATMLIDYDRRWWQEHSREIETETENT
jgi:hypothetical protein